MEVYGDAPIDWVWKNSAIRVNDLWIQPSSFANHIGRHSDSLISVSDDPSYQISLLGSVSLLKYRNQFFAIATQHQVASNQISRLALSVDAEAHFVTAGKYLFRTNETKEDPGEEHDLCAFDFTEPVSEGLLEQSRFFDVSKRNVVSDGERIVCGGVYGYAFSDHTVKIDDDDQENTRLEAIHRINREVICKYNGDAFDGQLAHWFGESVREVDVDGFSGAPVFAIVGQVGEFACKYSGTVVRGGGGNLYSLKAETVLRFLEAVAE